MSEAQREASYWMAANVNYILPVWILIISLMDRLFFWRARTNLAERVTAYSFIIAQYILLSTLIIPLINLDPRFQFSAYVILFSYLTYAITQWHGGGFSRGIRAFFLTLISFVFYVAFMNIIMISYFSYF